MAPVMALVPARHDGAVAQRFVLVPNPAEGWVSVVDRSGTARITRIELVDDAGRHHATRMNGDAHLLLEGLEPGTYTVRLHTSEGVYPVRLVKY